MSSLISSGVLIARASEQQLLAVDDLEPEPLQREEHLRLDDVDGERRVREVVLAQDGVRSCRRRPPRRFGRGASRRAASRFRAASGPEPGAVDLVVPRGRAEVPQVRLAAARQQAVAAELVLRPRADLGRRDVADVRVVEAEEGPDAGLLDRRAGARQAVLPQLLVVDPASSRPRWPRRSEAPSHRPPDARTRRAGGPAGHGCRVDRRRRHVVSGDGSRTSGTISP